MPKILCQTLLALHWGEIMSFVGCQQGLQQLVQFAVHAQAPAFLCALQISLQFFYGSDIVLAVDCGPSFYSVHTFIAECFFG